MIANSEKISPTLVDKFSNATGDNVGQDVLDKLNAQLAADQQALQAAQASLANLQNDPATQIKSIGADMTALYPTWNYISSQYGDSTRLEHNAGPYHPWRDSSGNVWWDPESDYEYKNAKKQVTLWQGKIAALQAQIGNSGDDPKKGTLYGNVNGDQAKINDFLNTAAGQNIVTQASQVSQAEQQTQQAAIAASSKQKTLLIAGGALVLIVGLIMIFKK